MTRDEILRKYIQDAPSARGDLLKKYAANPAEKMQDRIAPEPMTQQEYDQDVAKSVLSAGPKIILGMAGTPGFIEQVGRWAADKSGLIPGASEGQILPTPEGIQEGLQKAAPAGAQDYFFHQPQTTMGSVLQTGLEFTPGLPSMFRKGARQIAREAIDANAFNKEKNAAYRVLQNNDVRFNLDDYGNSVADTMDKLQTYDLKGTAAGRLARDVVKDVVQREKQNLGPDWNAMEQFHQRAGKIARLNSDNTQRAAASVIQSGLQDFRNTAGVTSNSLSPDEVMAATAKARDMAKRSIASDAVQRIVRKSENAVPQRREGIVQRGVDRILENDSLRSLFNEPQIAQLKAMRGGGKIGAFGDAAGYDIMGWLRKSPGAIIGDTLKGSATTGAAYLGVPGAAPVGFVAGAAGTAAKLAKPALQRKIGRTLAKDVMVGADAPPQQSVASRVARAAPWLAPNLGAATTQAPLQLDIGSSPGLRGYTWPDGTVRSTPYQEGQ